MNYKKPRKRLLIEIFAVFFLLTGIVISCTFLIHQKEIEEKKKLGNILKTLNTIESHGLELWFKEKKRQIEEVARQPKVIQFTKLLATIPAIKDSIVQSPLQNEIRDYFSPILEQFDYKGIFIVTPDHISRASMRNSNLGTVNFITKEEPEITKAVFSGETHLVTPLLSDVPIQKGQELVPTMFLLTPIKDETGKVLAFFSFRLNPKSLSSFVEKSWYGETNNTYAFNRKGQLITSSRFNDPFGLELKKGNTDEFALNILSAINGDFGSNLEGFINYKNQEVLSSWLWNEELGLGITSEISKAEAMKNFYEFRRSVVVSEIIVIILIGLIAALLIVNRFKKEKLVLSLKGQVKNLEDSMSNFFDNAPVGLAIKDMNGKYIEVNHQMELITGYTNEELNKMHYWEITPKVYIEMEKKLLHSLGNNERYGPYEKEYIHKNGHIINVVLTGVVVKSDGENKHIWSVVEDVTEVKKDERELKKQEERYRTLVGNIPGVVYRCALDKHWTMLFISNYIEKITGYSPTDFVKNKVRSYASIIHPYDVDYVDKEIKKAVNSNRSYIIEYRIIDKHGEVKWVYEQGKAIKNLKEDVNFLDGFIMDITDRKVMERELLINKEKADSANNAKSAFLANMSHEIKTPLNAILGHTQILKLSENLNESQENNLQSISKSGEHLLSLISDILDLSKIEAGKIELNKSNFNFITLLKDLQKLFAINSQKKNISLSINLSPDLPHEIYADEKRVRQVIINLLSNAIKFTHEGGVIINAKVKSKIIHVEVKDTGVGIPEDSLHTIFETFEQSESGKKTKDGVGLGLTISRDLAELMGGDLTVSSINGKGSSFVFTFEFDKVRKDKRYNSEEKSERVLNLATKKRGLKVFIIDDVLENIEVAKAILDPIGFEIETCIGDSNVLKKINEFHPDIIFLDLQIPNINVIELIQSIKNHNKLSTTPILALSASIFDDQKAMYKTAGVSDFISKPYKINQLLEMIKKHSNAEYIYENNEVEVDDKQVQNESISINLIPKDLSKQIINASSIGDVEELERINLKIKEIDTIVYFYVKKLISEFEFDELKRVFSANINVT